MRQRAWMRPTSPTVGVTLLGAFASRYPPCSAGDGRRTMTVTSAEERLAQRTSKCACACTCMYMCMHVYIHVHWHVRAHVFHVHAHVVHVHVTCAWRAQVHNTCCAYHMMCMSHGHAKVYTCVYIEHAHVLIGAIVL